MSQAFTAETNAGSVLSNIIVRSLLNVIDIFVSPVKDTKDPPACSRPADGRVAKSEISRSWNFLSPS